MLLVLVGFSQSNYTQNFTTSGSYTWTCPNNVTSITVECYGAGGGGGGANSRGSGGGGGGGYAKSIINVTPGTVYYLNVGAAGSAGTAGPSGTSGGNGGSTWFNASSTSLYTSSNIAPTSTSSGILSSGGNGGTAATGGAGGSGATTNYGSTTYNGGNGATGVNSANNGGGGGGSSACSTSNGTNGGTTYSKNAGTAGTGGGNGGAGGAYVSSNSNAGVAGTSPGGGGGGCYYFSSTNVAGGLGGTGKVAISYTACIPLFEQDFSSSTTLSDYVSAAPTNGQITDISTSQTINTTTSNKLRLDNSLSTGKYLARKTNFITSPTSLIVKFDITFSSVTGYSTSAATFYVGPMSSLPSSTSPSTSLSTYVNSRFIFSTASGYTSPTTSFKIKEQGTTNYSTSSYSGKQTITFVINCSGSTMTYLAPDGTTESIANGKNDIWVGSTKVFDETGCYSSAKALDNFYFEYVSGTGIIDIDNMTINSIVSAPSLNAPTSTTCSGFTANWTTTECDASLEVATDAAFTSMVSGYPLTVTGTSKAITGLSSGTSYYYRVRTKKGSNNSITSAYSSPTQIATTSAAAVISAQSTTTQTKCPGTSFLPITVTATGTGLTYQWYNNTSASTSGGTSVSGATSASYTPASNSFGTKYYYCIVSGTCGNATSSISESIILTPIIVSTLPTTDTYIWKGTTSGWKTASNWLYYTNSSATFITSTTYPSVNDNSVTVIVPNNSTCVTSYPTLNSSSSTDSTDFKDLIIEPGSTLTIGANSGISVHGNFTNNGTFVANSSSYVSFEGSTNQTISGNSTTFAKVIVKNTGGVTLGVNTTIAGELSLVSGKIYTVGNTLSLGTSTANGSVTGGGSSAYIVAYDNGGTIGKVKQYINSVGSYTFPIGDATNYTPMTYTHNSGATLASGINVDVYTSPIKITGLTSTYYVNRLWEVTPSSGITTANYNVSYTYVTGDITGTGLESTLYPIKLSGSTWYKPTGFSYPGTVIGTGVVNTSTHTLTWSGLTSFSSFGSGGGSPVALPISLISFTGKNSVTGLDKNKNILSWSTASEQNNDYFNIEKTKDGKDWNSIARENGAGNSTTQLYYSFVDDNVESGINYYRLKQTDYDGKFKYSETISIDNRGGQISKEVYRTLNIMGQEVDIQYYRGLVIIEYSDGSSEKIIK